MRGLLKDCFEISGRGLVVLLARQEGVLRVGDWVVIRDTEWRIAGFDVPNYFGRPIPSEEVRRSVCALREAATKADLAPFVGQPFETEGPGTGAGRP
jgi:hypothetical protein